MKTLAKGQLMCRTLNLEARPPPGSEPLLLLWPRAYLSALSLSSCWPCIFSTLFGWVDLELLTKRSVVAKPGKTKAVHRLLPVCPAWCGQRVGQGLILLMSVCTGDEEGFLCLAYPEPFIQNCFQDPSVVKSENVLCTITQANTMSQDKYALLVSRPEMKQKQVFPILGLIAYMCGYSEIIP